MQPEEEKLELEEQFILRLPTNHAKTIREILHSKPKKIKKLMKLELDVLKRSGRVRIGKTILRGNLKTFPTIVESYKTIDKVNCFKTADVSHVLICEDRLESGNNIHGLTAPLKNVKKRRFRKTLYNENQALEAEKIERELLYLLRTDQEAVSTKYEILYEDNKQDLDQKEIILFGNLSSDSEENESE